MKVISKSEFFNIIHEACHESCEDLFVVFAAFYTKKEAEQATLNNLNLEVLEYDGSHDYHVWLNDWDEGEQYIVYEGIFTSRTIINKLIERK